MTAWLLDDMAWHLAGEVADSLTDADRTTLYVELGSGEYWSAITRLLTHAQSSKLPLAADFVADATACLDRYLGAVEESLVRALLAPGHGNGRAFSGIEG